MYNGNHHEIEAGATTKPNPEAKPANKSATIQKPEPANKPKSSKK